MGTGGNERVNQVAKRALKLLRVNLKSLPTTAALSHYTRQHVTQLWKAQRRNLRPHNKLAQLKNLPTLTVNVKTREQDITLAWLRIGHTRITRPI